MEHDVRVFGRGFGRREPRAEQSRDRSAPAVDVDDLHVASGHAGGEPRHETPDRARTDDDDPVAQLRARIPERVYRRFDVRGEHRTRGRHVRGQHVNRAGWHDVLRLMRIQHEYMTVVKVVRTAFDATDTGVAVL